MTILAFPTQPGVPETGPVAARIDFTPALETLLGDFTVQRLIDAVIVLTHQIHDAPDEATATILREQRMMARLELERRAA